FLFSLETMKAALFDPPSAATVDRGRRRKKGRRLPNPYGATSIFAVAENPELTWALATGGGHNPCKASARNRARASVIIRETQRKKLMTAPADLPVGFFLVGRCKQRLKTYSSLW